MRLRPLLLIVAVLAFAPRPAASQLFIGPNLEWSHWDFDPQVSSESMNVLAVGGFYLNPGLRLGYVLPGASFVISVDTGVQSERGDFDYTNVIVEPGVAYVVMSDLTTSPYIGISTGWNHVSLENVTRPLVGGSVGFRHRVSGGHGIVRAELRYDHFTEEDTDGLVLPENIVGIRIGADLLLTR